MPEASEGLGHGSSPGADQDAEVSAMHRIITALNALDGPGRERVLSYVARRFGIELRAEPGLLPGGDYPSAKPVGPVSSGSKSASTPPGMDIRTLRELKQPHSLTEMVALVAFYLKEIADSNERKDTISTEDVEKYFKQGGYRLPARSRMVLVNARNAGYLDPTGEPGVYKLNPVGYNLVAYSLPSVAVSEGSRRRKRPSGPRNKTN
jgi:hypothetical protein